MAALDELGQQLQRWVEGGLLDAQSAERIRAFETSRETPGVRWPVVLAIAFGAIMVAAGILLFVAAHWDNLSPAQRFLLVLAMISGLHMAAGALSPRMHALGLSLHGVGTVALGAGIYLAGQIFNLEEHWPGGVMLWAIGAVLAWLVLRDWVQATLAALLIPAWVISEWSVRAERYHGSETIIVQFICMMAVTYLSARFSRGTSSEEEDSYFRRALVWVGGIVVLPAFAAVAVGIRDQYWNRRFPQLSLSLHVTGLLIAFVLPLLAAYLLRGRAVVWNLGFACWIYLVALIDNREVIEQMTAYVACALAAIGFVFWGLKEQRRERIDLGIAGFAVTIIVFYFSSVMGKMGRSASLVGFGLLFLLGGWKLEQLRRKLVARTVGVTQ